MATMNVNELAEQTPPKVNSETGVVLTIDTGAGGCYPFGMPRKLRIQYPGAMYHVMNRGDQREPIFKDNEDRQKFLSTLGEACQKTDWQIHAYCLMSMRTVCDYVHLNPVRAKLLGQDEPLESYRWSSYGLYLKEAGQRPAWLRVDRLLGEKGIPGDTAAGRAQFAVQMERRRAEETSADYEALRRDWTLGSETFRQELLAAVAGQVGPSHYAAQRQETDLQKAERIVREELDRAAWGEEHLLAQPKGSPVKVELARRLRKETTMSLKWIAQRLQTPAPPAQFLTENSPQPQILQKPLFSAISCK